MAKPPPPPVAGQSLAELEARVNPKKAEQVLLYAISERLERVMDALENQDAGEPGGVGKRYQ